MKRRRIQACVSLVSAITVICCLGSNDALGATTLNNKKVITNQKTNAKAINDVDDMSLPESSLSIKESNSISNISNNNNMINNKVIKEENTEQSSSPSKEGWNLVWNDEFEGTKLDENKWNYDIGNGYNGWGNYESQYYKKENVSVNDGKLKITAKKENQSGFSYTSGKITTKSDEKTLFSTKYGYIEAKMKLPQGTGLWPAFWMMPVDNAYGMWPLSGEIDIMEAKGRETDRYIGTIHYGEVAPNNSHAYGTYTSDNFNTSDYHVYAVEWDADAITWFVDGEAFYKATNWYTKSNGVQQAYPAPFDKDFYLILNLAVGGNFDNFQMPADSSLPQAMEVDYVRVYHKNNSDTPSGNDDNKDEDNKWETSDDEYMTTVDENLVINGDFNNGYDSWTPYNTYFNIQKADNNSYARVMTKQNLNSWDVMFMQKNLKLKASNDYELSFKAKATANNQDFIVKVEDAAYNPILNEKFNVNTNWQSYTYRFTATKDSYFDLKYLLGAATANCKLDLDDISILCKTGKTNPQGSNLITNGDFSDKYDSWYPYNSYYDLEEVDGNIYPKVYASPTEVEWDKMFLQNGISMKKGVKYTLSFKAKSSIDNENFKVVMADSNYTPIISEKFTTSTKWQNYSYEIIPKMTGCYDIKFYLGLVSKDCSLNVDDITLTTDEVVEENKNLVSNGDFNSNYDSWNPYNTYYELKDNNGNKYSKIFTGECVNPWDKMFLQSGITLDKNTTYCLSFRAKASINNQKFGVKIEDSNYSGIFNEEFDTSISWNKYEYLFTTDESGQFDLKFLLGSVSDTCSLFLDDISIIKRSATTENNDPINLISNGDFTIGNVSWNPFNTYFDLEEKDGNMYSRIYTGVCQNSWDLMFLQSGINLEANKNYEISFKAKCSEDNQKFGLRIENKAYEHAFDVEFITGLEWQTYTYKFTSNMTGSVDAKYLLGLVDKTCALYLDDIVIYQK